MGKKLVFEITVPPAGGVVGRTVTVSGIARVDNANSNVLGINIEGVKVDFGIGTPAVDAVMSAATFSATTALPAAVVGGSSLHLVATLHGTRHFDNGQGEGGEPVPFQESRFVDVKVALTPPPGFTLLEPANGTVVDLREGGGDVDVALSLVGNQYFPLTVSITRDGQTTTEQVSAGTGVKTNTHLKALPLGPRTISVSVANPDGAGPAQTRTVTGRDAGPPLPRVDSPLPAANLIGDVNGAVVLPMTGIATDTQSGMVGGSAGVAWALTPSGTRTPAQPLAGNDFSAWKADVPLSGFGAHTVNVWATDADGNTSDPVSVPVTVISSFVPSTLAERLSEREYLAALLSFAQERVSVPGSTLDTATLVAALGQPLDRLSQPLSAAADRGGREVNQLRVPIELLRARIAATGRDPAPGAAGESAYRAAAYATLLAAAGTSYAELRLARGADAGLRQALAARLGIGLGATTPDELDQLVLDGPALTEAALEALFGLPDTTAADPLRAPATPLLLAWRITAQALAWADQDQHPGAPRTFPVLADPDVIGPADVVTGPAGNPVRERLALRAAELTEYANVLDAMRTAAGDAASGLAAIVGQALPGADLAALEALDRQGTDIDPELAALGVTRAGFRYLRTAAGLAATGVLTAAEWTDAVAVLTGAHKSTLVTAWRAQETGFVLSPDYFVLSGEAPAANPYRVDGRARADWQTVLRGRVAQRQDLLDAGDQAVGEAEREALPVLRDALLADLSPAGATTTAGSGAGGVIAVGEEMSALFFIDVLAGGALRTTRLRQAIESVQSLLSAKRSGELAPTHPAFPWSIDVEEFTPAWAWLGELGTWQAATTAFLFPERHLDPVLLVPGVDPPSHVDTLFAAIRGSGPFSQDQARHAGRAYLDAIGVTGLDYLDPPRSLEHQGSLRELSRQLGDAAGREALWVVPMLLAQRLQSAGDYRAALDWFWIVYPYDVAAPVSGYDRINTEAPFRPDLTFPPQWTTMLDPFALVATRPTPYTRYTLLSIIRCHLDFADAEFTRETDESIAHARNLYVTARRLLDAPVLVPQAPTNSGEPALPIPELDTLRARAEVQLAKLRQGRNIAGLPRTRVVTATTTVRQPTPLRFKTLLERARQLTTQASQVEAGYLAALEKYDERGLRLFDALKGVDLSAAQTTLAEARVQEAQDAVGAAQAQLDRADAMAGAYTRLIDAPVNRYEQNLLDDYPRMRAVKDLISFTDMQIGIMAAAASVGGATGLLDTFGASAVNSVALSVATTVKGIAQGALNELELQVQADTLRAGIEQRTRDWRLQRTAAEQEALVAAAGVRTATDHVAIATRERAIADLQHDQAVALVRFLHGQFTNADLYQWMSNTLGGVYRYFLQQATATARLAQAQLAFERAEPEQSLIRNDYWQPAEKPAANTAALDRRGLTGAEQLAVDIARLDEYAVSSERRRLNLAQTFSLARLMPVEFAEFRRTGALAFATPMSLFDNDFPGHYLRLIRRVRAAVVALVPPDRGIRATLSSNGISRVVTGHNGMFADIVVRHDPSLVALTSPLDATGVFELDTQSDMLLPFESSGVDTTWELRLPPAANPLDFSAIADVLITIEYTALHDENYRGQLIARLNQDRQRGADRVFSLSRDFPDQWYDLLNPADPDHRAVTVALRDLDFPVGIDALSTSAVAVRLVGRADLPDVVVSIHKGQIGGGATATGGLAGTRRGNAAAWLPLVGTAPTGDWELGVDPNAGALFDAGDIEDVLLLVGWTGQAPAWTS